MTEEQTEKRDKKKAYIVFAIFTLAMIYSIFELIVFKTSNLYPVYVGFAGFTWWEILKGIKKI